jgi:hypothetical protein
LFLERFGPPPARPGKGGVVEGAWDFSETDILMPHPVYGWMSWVAVLNPSANTFAEMHDVIEAAYGRAKALFDKKAG